LELPSNNESLQKPGILKVNMRQAGVFDVANTGDHKQEELTKFGYKT
jgi:hypothetical protein